MEPEEAARLEESRRMLEAGDADAAIRVVQAVLRARPESGVAHLLLAEGYLRKASGANSPFLKLAEREFDAAWRLAPPEVETHRRLVAVALRLRRGAFVRDEYAGRLNALPFAAELARETDEAPAPGRPRGGGASVRGFLVHLVDAVRSPVLMGSLAVLVVAGWLIVARHSGAVESLPFGFGLRTRVVGLANRLTAAVPGLGHGEYREGGYALPGTVGVVDLNGLGVMGELRIFQNADSARKLFMELSAGGEATSVYVLKLPFIVQIDRDTAGGAVLAAVRLALPGCLVQNGEFVRPQPNPAEPPANAPSPSDPVPTPRM